MKRGRDYLNDDQEVNDAVEFLQASLERGIDHKLKVIIAHVTTLDSIIIYEPIPIPSHSHPLSLSHKLHRHCLVSARSSIQTTTSTQTKRQQ
jgi:hypothetical protein